MSQELATEIIVQYRKSKCVAPNIRVSITFGGGQGHVSGLTKSDGRAILKHHARGSAKIVVDGNSIGERSLPDSIVAFI